MPKWSQIRIANSDSVQGFPAWYAVHEKNFPETTATSIRLLWNLHPLGVKMAAVILPHHKVPLYSKRRACSPENHRINHLDAMIICASMYEWRFIVILSQNCPPLNAGVSKDTCSPPLISDHDLT